jgi:primosomal protein N' (replication factor Y)
MERKTFFVDVLLPVPLPGTFTYRVPYELNDSVSVGMRVVIQFGQKKIYTGLIRRIHEKAPDFHQVKYILSILDQTPIVNEKQLDFWDWIAAYYLCYPGEVMNAALPSALKLASETKIVLAPDFDKDYAQLNDREFLIVEALELRKVITITDASRIVDTAKVIPLIKTLIEKGVVLTQEELTDRYKPRLETYLKLKGEYAVNEEFLKEEFNKLGTRAFKQLELLMRFVSLSHCFTPNENEVTRTELLKDFKNGLGLLKALLDKGILETYKREVSRLTEKSADAVANDIVLTDIQQQALDELNESFKAKDTVLLHGITGSGKTELYIRLIDNVISQGKQVLYLLPEIALTSQIINRLRKYFGPRAGVYHSKYNEQERVEIWNRVLLGNLHGELGQYSVILGARSSLFLPFENLGLVIVDEEHDTSYKQMDPAPRYNARDAAIMLARMHGAQVLLGSATPSVESYYNAREGKYALVELNKRYGGMLLPEVLCVNLKEAAKSKQMQGLFSSFLIDHIKLAIGNKEQVILFQNRRGFSLRIECDSCNWMPQCVNCDVTLIYHKKENHLRCHYCGFTTRVPEKCPSCNSTSLKMKGFGTEKVEEELQLMLPGVHIERMDLDTTRSKSAHQRIISDFEDKKIDVLVGTQMVTKGLDFDNVSLVGILNADNMISYPDFRSFERSYQQIAQVSGRAGRRNKRGKVVIQTYNPEHSVIQYVMANDYEAMYNSQILERRNFKYPPFYRLVKLTLQHKNEEILNKAANELAVILRQSFGKRVLGPEYPTVSRVRNYFLKNILLKFERSPELSQMKEALRQHCYTFLFHPEFKQVRIIVDVDPV